MLASEASFAWAWWRAIRDHPTLPAPARLAAAVLHSYMDPDGSRCWPTMPKIARGMGAKSPYTATRAVAELERAGFVEVKRHTGRRYAPEFTPRLPEPGPHKTVASSDTGRTPGPHNSAGLDPTIPRPGPHKTVGQPSQYQPIDLPTGGGGSNLNEKKTTRGRTPCTVRRPLTEQQARTLLADAGHPPEITDQAVAAYRDAVADGTDISHHPRYLAGIAGRIAASNGHQPHSPAAALSDDDLARRLRASRDRGLDLDSDAVDEAFRRGWPEERVAELTQIASPDWLTPRARAAQGAQSRRAAS